MNPSTHDLNNHLERQTLSPSQGIRSSKSPPQ